MKRLETGNMGRKQQIQFWKAREGDILLQCFITQHHTNPAAFKKDPGWETRGKASCRVKAAVLCFFWRSRQLLLVSESAQGHLPPKGTEGWVCQAPTSQLQASRQRGTGREAAAQGGSGDRREAGAGRPGVRGDLDGGLPLPVLGRGKMHRTAGRGRRGMGRFTPSKQEQMGLGLNTTKN